MSVSGWIMDPASGGRHEVTVETQGHSLVLCRDDGKRQSFDPERLRPLERRGATEIYTLKDMRGFRLGLTCIDDRMVEARLPEFPLGTKGGRNRSLLPVMLGAAAIGVIGAVVVPF